MGFHGLHCGAGRLEWSEDPPRPHRRLRLLKLPCQTHWLVDEDLLAKHDAVTAHRRLDQIAHLETDRVADLLGDGDLELRAHLWLRRLPWLEKPDLLNEGRSEPLCKFSPRRTRLPRTPRTRARLRGRPERRMLRA